MSIVTETSPTYSPATKNPLESALDRVGDRWSLLLVDALLVGGRRFGELREELPGLAPNILTERLRRLEREGIVVATPYSTRPPRMEYSLTGDGRDLASALRLLADWGARRDEHGEPLRHDRCGTRARGTLVLPDVRVGGQRSRDGWTGDATALGRGRDRHAARIGQPALPISVTPVTRE